MEFMASSSNHGSNSSSSTDDEILEQLFFNMHEQRQCVFACAFVVANSFNMSNVNELEEGVRQSMDLGMGIQDVLVTMQATPRLFKSLISHW